MIPCVKRSLRALLLAGLVWVSQDFDNPIQMTNFLNQLPAERQVEAKVIAYTYASTLRIVLFYRVEKPDKK